MITKYMFHHTIINFVAFSLLLQVGCRGLVGFVQNMVVGHIRIEVVMARFRATIKGARGEASRLGTAKSGLLVHVNGWNVGVTITAAVAQDGKDILFVYETGGSNDHKPFKLLATIVEDQSG